MILRPCSRCRIAKPAKSFGRDSSRPDGLAVRCLACKAGAAREARARAKRGDAPVVELRPGLRLVSDVPSGGTPTESTSPPGDVAPAGGGASHAPRGAHRTALEAAIAAADWLTDVHAATVAYARSLSDLLDAASLEGVLPGRAEPQYLLALKALGLHYTPPTAKAEAPPARMFDAAGY